MNPILSSCLRSCTAELDDEIGRGSYCAVHRISGFTWSRGQNDDGDIYVDSGTGNEIRNTDTNNGTGSLGPKADLSKYVVKVLRSDVSEQLLITGKMDLRNEAILLSHLSHQNITKLHAISPAVRRDVLGTKDDSDETGIDDRHFLVLERLYDTLHCKLDVWKMETQLNSWPSWFSMFGEKQAAIKKNRRRKNSEIWHERISVALDVACGLEHLHKLRIVYRDLTPKNVGFDANGRAKLFDFGLSKKLPPEISADGTYKLTGNTGSQRYMAPEVALSLPYNESADVYSYAILLWQICSLELPYENQSYDKYFHSVVLGGSRLPTSPSWPVVLSHLIKRCWSAKPSNRASFSECVEVLEKLEEVPAEELVGAQPLGCGPLSCLAGEEWNFQGCGHLALSESS